MALRRSPEPSRGHGSGRGSPHPARRGSRGPSWEAAQQAADAEAQQIASLPSAAERLSGDLSLIQDQRRAGDYTDAQAAAATVAQIQAALSGQYGDLSDRERLSLRGDLAEAQRAQAELTTATQANTSELAANTAALQQIAAFNTSLVGRQVSEISRALADMIEGQLGVPA